MKPLSTVCYRLTELTSPLSRRALFESVCHDARNTEQVQIDSHDLRALLLAIDDTWTAEVEELETEIEGLQAEVAEARHIPFAPDTDL